MSIGMKIEKKHRITMGPELEERACHDKWRVQSWRD